MNTEVNKVNMTNSDATNARFIYTLADLSFLVHKTYIHGMKEIKKSPLSLMNAYLNRFLN